MNVICETLERIETGVETTFENLTLFPLLDPKAPIGEPDYLTLDEALTRQLAHITEVSESGSVPELKFVNESDRRVLLLDGEELQGAKQNRILNLTILVGAKQTLLVPVSCVEAGRWSHRSAEFAAAGHAHWMRGEWYGPKPNIAATSRKVAEPNRYSCRHCWFCPVWVRMLPCGSYV